MFFCDQVLPLEFRASVTFYNPIYMFFPKIEFIESYGAVYLSVGASIQLKLHNILISLNQDLI